MSAQLRESAEGWKTGSTATEDQHSIVSAGTVSPAGPFPTTFTPGCMMGASFVNKPHVHSLSGVQSGAL